MPNQSIRHATPSDLARIIELIEGIARYTNTLAQLEVTEDKLKQHIFGENPVAKALVATEPTEGKIVGYAIYYYTFSTFLGRPGVYLEDLFVEDAHRGHGLGKGLFLEVARIAHAEGCGRMEWLALSWNELALDFYEKQGAVLHEDFRLIRLDEDTLGRLSGSIDSM